jgi:hypothetical protein
LGPRSDDSLGGLADQARPRTLLRQQRLNLALQFLVASTRFGEKYPAEARCSLQSRVINLLELLPAVGLHRRVVARYYIPSPNLDLCQRLEKRASRKVA